MKQGDCDRIFAQLSAYLDRELASADCEELERHIRDCGPCVEFVESLKKSVRLCRQYQPPHDPPPLSEDDKRKLQDAYARMLASRAMN